MIPILNKDGSKTWIGKIKDFFRFKDKFGKNGPGLKGRVIGYRTDDNRNKIEKIIDKDNLIVYGGRMWAFQKLFNYQGGQIAQYQPYWFGVGKGGVASDDPNHILQPNDHDADLYAPVVMDVNNASYAQNGYKKPVSDPYFFVTQDIIAIVYNIYIDKPDANENGSVPLSELGLFLAPTQNPNESQFQLLSHVTFGIMTKTPQDSYAFEWWLYI